MSALSLYDYVIVGAGSAGCTLANRLAEKDGLRILVLEAGPADSSFLLKMPAGFASLGDKTPYNWRYETTPQKHCNDRRMYWPRGKTLGGSSAINAMLSVRGHAWDYDHWRQLGNEGWSYNDVLPYFKKAENNERGGDAHADADELGHGGRFVVGHGRSLCLGQCGGDADADAAGHWHGDRVVGVYANGLSLQRSALQRGFIPLAPALRPLRLARQRRVFCAVRGRLHAVVLLDAAVQRVHLRSRQLRRRAGRQPVLPVHRRHRDRAQQFHASGYAHKRLRRGADCRHYQH